MQHRKTLTFRAKPITIASLSLLSFLAASFVIFLYSSVLARSQSILLTQSDSSNITVHRKTNDSLSQTPRKGLIVVMPFTKNDLSRIEENLKLWDEYPPCDTIEGAQPIRKERAATGPNGDVEEEGYSGKINTAFYFYFNGFMDDDISERISTWKNSTSSMKTCFDEIGHISAFLTGDEDNYDPRRFRGNWVRGPNNQFYALLLHNNSNDKDEKVDSPEGEAETLALPMLPLKRADRSETQTDPPSAPNTAFHPIEFVPQKSDNLPTLQSMSSRFQYLFLMEPDSRPIRINWRDTLLSETGLSIPDTNGARNFWLKGSAYRGKCVFEKAVQVSMEEEAAGNCKLLGQQISGHINGNALYNIGDPNFIRFLTQVQDSEFGAWPYDLAIHLYLTSPIRESENRNRLHLYQHSNFIQNYGRYPFDIDTVRKEETAFVHSDERLQKWEDAPRGNGATTIGEDDNNPFADRLLPTSNETILESTPEFVRLLSAAEKKLDQRRNLAVTFLPAGSMERPVNRILLTNWIKAWMRLAGAESWNPLALKERIVAGEPGQEPLLNVLLFAFTEEDRVTAVRIITRSCTNNDDAARFVYLISQESDLQYSLKHRRTNNDLVREMNTMAWLMLMNIQVLRSDLSSVWLRNPFTYFSTLSYYDLELSRIASTSSSFPSSASSLNWVIGRFASRVSESPSLSVSFSRPSRRTVSFYESLAALHADRPTESIEALVNRHLRTNVYGVKYRILESSFFPESHDYFEKRVHLRTGLAVPFVVDPRRWINDVVSVPDGTTKVKARMLQTWRYLLEENDAWFVDDQDFRRAELEEFQSLTRAVTDETNVLESLPIPGSQKYLAYYERPMDNGLNNAREALRCALAMALVLNRTLILPEFHAHHRLNTPVGLEYFFDPQVFLETWRGVLEFRSHAVLEKLRNQALRDDLDDQTPVFYIDIGYKDLDPRLLQRGDKDRGAIDEDGGWPWMNSGIIPLLGSRASSKLTLDRPHVQFKPGRNRRATAVEIQGWFSNYSELPVIDLSRSFRRFGKFSESDDDLLNRRVAAVFEERLEQSLVPSKMIQKAADFMIAAMNDISTGASQGTPVLQAETGYACLHLRRGDFLKVHASRERGAADPQKAADKAADVFARLTSVDPSATVLLNVTLYLSSDESSSTELLSAFRSRFAKVITSQDLIHRIQSPKTTSNGKTKSSVLETFQFLKAISTPDGIYGWDQRLGLVEQEVCGHGNLFVGNAYSTFSTRICQVRKSRRQGKGCHDMHGRKWPE